MQQLSGESAHEGQQGKIAGTEQLAILLVDHLYHPQQTVAAKKGRGQQRAGTVVELDIHLRIEPLVGGYVVNGRTGAVLGNPPRNAAARG